MQQPSSSSSSSQQQQQHQDQQAASTTGGCDSTVQEVQMSEEDYARAAIRRNALTPESDQIEPIKQTEIQERMSGLSVSSSSSGGGSGAGGTSSQVAESAHSSRSGEEG